MQVLARSLRMACGLLGLCFACSCVPATVPTYKTPKIRHETGIAVDIVDGAIEPPPVHKSARGWSRPMLRIIFVSSSDLAEFTRWDELTPHNVATMCKGADLDRAYNLQNDPYIYDDSGAMVNPGQTNDVNKHVPSRTYRIYLSLKAVPLAGGEDVFLYDLQSQPADICFRLEGGNMLGLTFATNTVKISREEIIHAVQRERRH